MAKCFHRVTVTPASGSSPPNLVIAARRAQATDDEFRALVADAETAYRATDAPFYLVFDLLRLELVPLHQAHAWMELFERVRPITERLLLCTSLCLASPILRGGVELFLALYHPVKPLHVFGDFSECTAHLDLERCPAPSAVTREGEQLDQARTRTTERRGVETGPCSCPVSSIGVESRFSTSEQESKYDCIIDKYMQKWNERGY